ncbi:MAG: hypothetical protein ACREMT_00560 [Vulcanimicrobiaceae bacterium]
MTLARQNEREARHRLEEGCAADLASMELLFAATMTIARQQLHDALRAPHEDLTVATEAIVVASVRRLHDSANIRFRARFRNYAEAVWQSEAHLLAPPRRIALPHVELEAPVLQPLAARERAHVDAWLSALCRALRESLCLAVNAARGRVIRRVIASTARARARTSRTRSIAG